MIGAVPASQPIQPSAVMRPAAFNAMGWLWDAPTPPELAPDGWYLAARADHALARADRAGNRARIEGVLLLAKDDGQPLDLAVWLLATPEPGRAIPVRTPIPARPSRADWRA